MKKRRLLVVALVLGITGGLLGWGYDVFIEGGNFRIVRENVLYRSGTLSHHEWKEVRRENPPFKSVLNLRGESKEEWYSRERALSEQDNISYASIRLSANREPDMATMEQIVEVMRSAPKPLLVHCMQGADRTGLASALYVYAIEGKPAEVADNELSIYYGHFPWLISRSGAMDRAFAKYVVAHPQQTTSRQ